MMFLDSQSVQLTNTMCAIFLQGPPGPPGPPGPKVSFEQRSEISMLLK